MSIIAKEKLEGYYLVDYTKTGLTFVPYPRSVGYNLERQFESSVQKEGIRVFRVERFAKVVRPSPILI